MADDIDNKVVSITFDNASFERKLSETISSLDKLRHSLDFAGAKKGISELSTAGQNFNMGNMGVTVEGVSSKFLAMSTIAITALSNITTKALSTGASMVKSLSFGPIMDGFREYETNIGSIQTILANTSSKGTTLDDVNSALDQLNTYSDQTIYNFSQMAKNIGTFTAAGVDLDKSVNSIKGIANLAAISGSTSDQASTAMYQLSQALSAGKLTLMDWNSVVNAGMGGEVLKKALFETGKAMGTITDVPLSASFEDWEKKGGTFREQLQNGWITADVLSNTLNAFSGDLDAAALSAIGFSEAQAAEMQRLGKLGIAAATEVKTMTQLFSTVKESIGSGWSTTFRTVIGDFEESKSLFTGLNNVIGGFIGKQADARNAVLKTWNDFGSRVVFFESLGDIFIFLGDIIKPIAAAFREMFPRKTGADLVTMTYKFSLFTDKLKIGADTSEKIKSAFTAFFAVLDIGWEIIKGVVSVVGALVKGVWSLISPILGLVASSGDAVTGFHDMLVEGGGLAGFFDLLTKGIDSAFGAIRSFASIIFGFLDNFRPVITEVFGFFKGLGPVVLLPYEALKKLTRAIGDFFSSLSFGKDEKDGVTETAETLDKSAGLADRLLAALKNVFSQIGDFMGGIVSGIAGAFKGLGGAIADALGSGDFNQVLNILKTGALGGILIYIRKFFREGLKLDFGQGALFDKIGNMLDTVTGALKSMQAEIRAETILKIAGAMGILAVAIVALSLVDSAALTKAMVAITIGLTELTGVMLALEKMSGPGGSLKIFAMSAGMVAMAAAMTLLVIPIKVLSTMSMGDLAKGLVGVGASMLIMATSMKIIGSSASLSGIARAGAAMILISIAMIVLAKAIKSFAEMNLTEMAFGLAQAAIGIGLLILALKFMPDDVAKKGLGLLILAFSLRSLAKVVQLFAGISLGVLAKGFIAISIGLQLIGIAMQFFPEDMIQTAAGLAIVSLALMLIGKAIEQVGNIPFLDLIKGVVGLSAMLVVLAGAVNVMSAAQGGVASLIAASIGLLIIGKAIQEVGNIPLGELLKGLAGLAAALAVLAIASLAAPGLFILGAALLLIGAGLALVGAGVALAGKGFELLAKFGSAGLGHIVEALQAFIRELPGFVAAFVNGLIDSFVEIGKRAPEIVDVIKNLLVSLLDAVIEIVPKIKDTLVTIITSFLDLVNKKTPEFVKTGFIMLLSFLDGVRKNTGRIVKVVAEIVVEFINALRKKLPSIIEAGFNFILTFLKELAYKIGESATAFIPIGQALIDGFITGLVKNVSRLLAWFVNLPSQILDIIKDAFGINSPASTFIEIGVNLIEGLLKGLVDTVPKIMAWIIQFPLDVLMWIGDLALTLLPKGVDLIAGLLAGIIDKAGDVISWFAELPGKIIGWLGDVKDKLIPVGVSIILGLLKGLIRKIVDVKDWVLGLKDKILRWIGNAGGWLLEIGKDIIRGLWEGIKSMKDWLFDKLGQVAGWIPGPIKNVLGIDSPSKLFMGFGINIIEGLVVGMRKMELPAKNASASLGEVIKRGFAGQALIDGLKEAMLEAQTILSDMDEFNPTITPVLDLAKVQVAAKDLDKLVSGASISPNVSLTGANIISNNTRVPDSLDVVETLSAPSEIKFEQNIYAPEALSTNDIYRNTKGQIKMAKEELKI